MKLSEYINELQNIFNEFGDLEVDQHGPNGRSSANPPFVGYRLILQGKESRPRFWASYEKNDRKGQMVVCI